MTQTTQWYEVMPVDDLWDGDMVGVRTGATDVLLLSVDGEVRAYVDRCPHQATKLSDGDLDGGVLTCGSHLWEFDACSGAGINPDNCRLTDIPVKVEDGMIFVELA